MMIKIHHQSAFDPWPLEEKSVQAIITSPPYWSLRKYAIPDIVIDGWTGQFGLEENVKLYIDHLIVFMDKCWKFLKDDGICWVNIGDTYGGSWQNYNGKARGKEKKGIEFKPPCRTGKSKSLSLVPERFIIACQDAGWIIRNVIIWHKPNGTPESVKDRFNRCFEYVYMLTKQKKYYFDIDAVRVKTGPAIPIEEYKKWKSWGNHKHDMEKGNRFENHVKRFSYPKGSNPGNVWRICNQPSKLEHFASYPEELVDRMILCSSKQGDKILDPFCGSGTTLRVAEKFNRIGIGIDLGYQEIQKIKLNNIQKVFIPKT